MQTRPFLYYWDDLDVLNYFHQFQANYQELQNEGTFLIDIRNHVYEMNYTLLTTKFCEIVGT